MFPAIPSSKRLRPKIGCRLGLKSKTSRSITLKVMAGSHRSKTVSFDQHRLLKYMGIVDAIAKLSKDESTKVGSIILGPSFEVRSLGYNGAPRGCVADEDARNQRPEKLFWFSHAELNAITNAARVGTPLNGCALLVTHPPCMDCARAIVQAGIVFVVTRNPGTEFLERWEEHTRRTKQLFDECKVDYVMV